MKQSLTKKIKEHQEAAEIQAFRRPESDLSFWLKAFDCTPQVLAAWLDISEVTVEYWQRNEVPFTRINALQRLLSNPAALARLDGIKQGTIAPTNRNKRYRGQRGQGKDTLQKILQRIDENGEF